MSINIPIPMNLDGDLHQCLSEICRRASDSTTQMNVANTINITNGDLKIVTAGRGVVIPSLDGTKYYRLVMDNDGALTIQGPI